MRPRRQGLIVWYRHRRNVRQLKKYGHLLYASRKMKYVVLYVNQDETEKIKEALKNLSFVEKVEASYKPKIRTSFAKKDITELREYDYHIGI